MNSTSTDPALRTPSGRIQILQVADCPLVDKVHGELNTCLAAVGLHERVEVLIGDYPSPTLVIDGLDVVTGEPVAGEPRCRLDLPSSAQIQTALARRSSRDR